MRRHVIVGVVTLLLGMALGGGLTAWGTAELRAQPTTRWETERYTGFMFIRDTDTSTCYLAVEGGSIIGANCGRGRR